MPTRKAWYPERPVHWADAIVGRFEFRLAESAADHATVLELRRAGYGADYTPASFPEELDLAPNAAVILASRDGRPCATARILDGKRGAIELDRFIRVADVVPKEEGYAEMTRLVASPVSRKLRYVLLMCLYKTYLNYCVAHGIPRMIVSAKAALAFNYLEMGFVDVGDAGAYTHASLAASPHRTYTLELKGAEQTLHRIGQHILAAFIFERCHPNLLWSV